MFDEYEILYKAFITAKNAKDDAQSKLEAEEMAKKKIEADSSRELDEEGNDDPVRLVGKADTVDEDLGGDED